MQNFQIFTTDNLFKRIRKFESLDIFLKNRNWEDRNVKLPDLILWKKNYSSKESETIELPDWRDLVGDDVDKKFKKKTK